MKIYVNYLICILMNINENVKKRIKIEEKIKIVIIINPGIDPKYTKGNTCGYKKH